jgi:hypothetical protein
VRACSTRAQDALGAAGLGDPAGLRQQRQRVVTTTLLRSDFGCPVPSMDPMSALPSVT